MVPSHEASVAMRRAPQSAQADPQGPEIREGTVPAEIRDLHAQLQALDDVTGKLVLRLETAVIQRPVATQSAMGASIAISRCPIAGEIHAAADLACNITAKVNGILCCLEL